MRRLALLPALALTALAAVPAAAQEDPELRSERVFLDCTSPARFSRWLA